MKKEDFVTYLVLWAVLIAICLYLICKGAPFSIYARDHLVIEPETEDMAMYEQLLAENQLQSKKKQKELEEQTLLEQQQAAEKAQQEKQAMEQAAAQAQAGEVRQVLSNTAISLEASGQTVNNCFIVDPNTWLEEKEVNPKTLLEKDMTMKSDASKPQILIYHTHATEGYVDTINGDESTTVVGVGDYLAQLLTERYGYHVLHIKEKYDLAEGDLNRSRAYNYARDGIAKVLEENPEIQVVIDLHRDGVDESKHLVTEVDGKPTAQIMFFNGLSRTNESGELSSLPNPYIQDNLAFSLQLEALCRNYYSNYIRGIYVKGYRYNLHFRPKSLLLEVGAQTNTLQEALNAMEPFADILGKLLKGT